MNSVRRMVVGGTFFATTCLLAVAGYMLAGWQLLDAVYMVVITVFGVGYGEAKPLANAELKIFTIAVIIAGCSSGIYVVGGFVQMLAEGEINRVLGSRRMSKGIENLVDHVIVCGYGRVGQVLAADLMQANQPLVVIDNCESRATEARAAGFLAILGTATEERTLTAAGVDRARVLAAVLPDDSANVFVTLTTRELNPTIQIIARAEFATTERKLLRSGANRVVLPACLGATRIAHIIVRPTAEDLLLEATGQAYLNEEFKKIGLELLEVELKANSPLVGESIGEVEMGGGFVLVAVKRRNNVVVRKPAPTLILEEGDVLMILGHSETLPQLARRAKPRTAVTYRGARA